MANALVSQTSNFILTDAYIAGRVINHLASSPGAPRHKIKKSLLAAALTCKLFRDPALDAIWQSLDSLIPLLKLLPPSRHINGFYVFNEVLQDTHGLRFDLYAARVKEFTLKSDDVAPSTYVQLAQFRPRPLPALRRLYCGPVSTTLRAFIQWPLFVSPSITHLELNGFDITDAYITEPLISSFASCSKPSALHLQHLVLDGQFPSLSALSCVAHFSKLKSLEISEKIDFETLRQLGTLHFLQNLKIAMPSTPIIADREIGFEHLQNLCINGEHPSIRSMLEHITTPRLELITLIAFCIPEIGASSPGVRKGQKSRSESTVKTKRIQEFPAYDWWRPCLEILNSRWSHSLSTISISLSPDIHTFADPMVLGLFRDLPPFRQLASLNFDNSGFAPTNDVIRDLAAACPELKDLRLSIKDCISHTPSRRAPDIEAFWVLAESCPNLSFLQIGLDTLIIPPFLTTKVMSHRLRQLSIGSLSETLSADQRLKIGRHLDRLFPWLDDMKTHEGYAADDWKYIWQLVQMYQLIRLDDLNRRK